MIDEQLVNEQLVNEQLVNEQLVDKDNDVSEELDKKHSQSGLNERAGFNVLRVSTVVIMLGIIILCIFISNQIHVSFYTSHFNKRNITGELCGLAGSGLGIGVLLAPVLNFFIFSKLASKVGHEFGIVF